jgi:hypothetical protein
LKKTFVCLLLGFVICNLGLTQTMRPIKYLIDSVERDSLASGWLELISETPIEKVWIDSIEISVSQNLLIEIETGVHEFQARAQNPANWFLQDIIDEIEIIANDTVKFNLFFPEFKMLNSDPYGADIWVGSNLLGKTPYLIGKEILSENKIVLSKFGYKDTTLSNVDQFFPTIWVTLDRDQNAQNETNQIMQLNFGQKRKYRNYALLTFGLGLASGVSAYLTKKEADNNYDNYLVASNPTEFNKFYNSAERYDRIAAVSYVIFEVNVLASTYYFFRYLLK